MLQKTSAGSFAASGSPSAVSNNQFNAANEMTAFNGTALTYDANGNLTNDGPNTCAWDAGNRLVGITGPNTASFVYDADGRRSLKSINGTTTQFLYGGLNPVQELQNGAPSAHMLTGLGIDEYFQRTDSAGARDYLTDILGSTLALTDASATIQTRYLYDPLGNSAPTGQASSNPYQFTGHENDNIGLDYYRNRYYDPLLGRFVSQDPIGIAGGINLYAYTVDDPTDLTDAFGLDAYICDRPIWPLPREFWKAYHQYICVVTDGLTYCFGLGPAGYNWFDTAGRWEPDKPNQSCQEQSKNSCVDNCLLGLATGSPPDYSLPNGFGGMNCKKLATSALAYCQAGCAAMSGGELAF